jgi:hypothetical protein
MQEQIEADTLFVTEQLSTRCNGMLFRKRPRQLFKFILCDMLEQT